jgi:arsenate reductase
LSRAEGEAMSGRVFNVLFLCTGNSARSILAESLLAHLGAGRFRAWSAGSHPKGLVHPLALEVLREVGLPVAGLRSKSWDEFEQADAPAMDFIFTVCDNAAGEACPLWLGHPVSEHWGIVDPAAVQGAMREQKAAFVAALGHLRHRIEAFVALPIGKLEPAALKSALQAIGAREGASAGAGTHD